MPVKFFRRRKAGPEVHVEDAVAQSVRNLFGAGYPLWTAGSLPIGAGRPDLVVVSCQRRIRSLANVEQPAAHILAYLRLAGRARPQTISGRTGDSVNVVIRRLRQLCRAKAVQVAADVYALAPAWRDILPDIITIEVKVTNWRKAVAQAGRNRIFSHRSFVAFPETIAVRVRQEQVLSKLGLGVLGVNERGEVRVLRRARQRKPRVWTYYYQLAETVATYCTEA